MLKNLNKKVLFLLLAIVILFAAVGIGIFITQQNTPKPQEYISKFFDIKSYGAYMHTKAIDDDTQDMIYFTKDVGTMAINDKNQPIDFSFLTQRIYKNFKDKWELFTTKTTLLPGSPEELINTKKDDFKIDSIKIKPNNIYCIELKLNDNCVVLEYKKDQIYQLYFTRDSKDLKMLRVIDQELAETNYYFAKVNDPQISVLTKFDELKPEIEKDLTKNQV